MTNLKLQNINTHPSGFQNGPFMVINEPTLVTLTQPSIMNTSCPAGFLHIFSSTTDPEILISNLSVAHFSSVSPFISTLANLKLLRLTLADSSLSFDLHPNASVPHRSAVLSSTGSTQMRISNVLIHSQAPTTLVSVETSHNDSLSLYQQTNVSFNFTGDSSLEPQRFSVVSLSKILSASITNSSFMNFPGNAISLIGSNLTVSSSSFINL